MDIESLAEVFASHGGAFHVPSREAVAPGRGPAHDVLWLGFLPQGEVNGVMFLLLSTEFTCGVEHLLEVASRKDAVGMVVIIFSISKYTDPFST